MPLSEVVAELASAIATARRPLTAREAYLLWVLHGMPLFRDVGRLDLWETAYKEVAPGDDATETERLIDGVFELGCENLYGAFVESTTRDCYRQLASLLAQAGILVPQAPDLTDW